MSDSFSKPGEFVKARCEPCEPTLKLGEGKLGEPQWAGCYLLEWEILVYEQANCWEACFFKWDAHHEHVKAFSMDDARSKAERRIRILETVAQRPDPAFYEERDSLQGSKSHNRRIQLGDTTMSTAIVKTCAIVLLAVLITSSFPVAASASNFAAPQQRFSDAELDELLAPIALYPDPLLAQVVPASTFVDQLEDADRVLGGKSDDNLIANQSWDVSVKSVAHYPQVLQMMVQKRDWTTALGQAYVNQSTDVGKSIQRLRAEAKAAGNLITTPQQQVISEGQVIGLSRRNRRSFMCPSTIRRWSMLIAVHPPAKSSRQRRSLLVSGSRLVPG